MSLATVLVATNRPIGGVFTLKPNKTNSIIHSGQIRAKEMHFDE